MIQINVQKFSLHRGEISNLPSFVPKSCDRILRQNNRRICLWVWLYVVDMYPKLPAKFGKQVYVHNSGSRASVLPIPSVFLNQNWRCQKKLFAHCGAY